MSRNVVFQCTFNLYLALSRKQKKNDLLISLLIENDEQLTQIYNFIIFDQGGTMSQ